MLSDEKVKKWLISQIEQSSYLECPIMDSTVTLHIKNNNLGIYDISILPEADKDILNSLKKKFPDSLNWNAFVECKCGKIVIKKRNGVCEYCGIKFCNYCESPICQCIND